MGGNKRRLQDTSERRSKEAVESEKAGAENLRGQLQQRREIIGEGLPESMQSARTGAVNLRETGGINPEIAGYGGYKEFAETGGFSPGEREQFLRRATAPTVAIYARTKDELGRQKALQGGYMPGFTASQNRLTRSAAQAGSEASLAGNVELNKQIREGKIAGFGGQERIEGRTQQGKIQGQELLQRYTQFGVAALNEVDINELRNRLQTGQISLADSQLLTQLAAQNKTLFENIMSGVGAVGGATAGILTGVGSLH